SVLDLPPQPGGCRTLHFEGPGLLHGLDLGNPDHARSERGLLCHMTLGDDHSCAGEFTRLVWQLQTVVIMVLLLRRRAIAGGRGAEPPVSKVRRWFGGFHPVSRAHPGMLAVWRIPHASR